MKTIQFNMSIRVSDEAAFRRAAYARALDELGGDEAQAGEYLDPELMTLGDCAVMLFDPGMSPDGASILESSAETVGE